MINKALKYLSNTRTVGEFFNQFEHEASPLMQGLISHEYVEVVQDPNRGLDYMQLTLKGTKALLDSEGLNYEV